MGNLRLKSGHLAKSLAAGLAVTVASVVIPVGVGLAEPAACGAGGTGCLSWSGGNNDQYKFGSSDGNLSNNHFVTETCDGIFPPCLPELVVADHIGRMRLNSAAFVRMCVYANISYANPIYWVTVRGVWATTGSAGKSLKYWTTNNC